MTSQMIAIELVADRRCQRLEATNSSNEAGLIVASWLKGLAARTNNPQVKSFCLTLASGYETKI